MATSRTPLLAQASLAILVSCVLAAPAARAATPQACAAPCLYLDPNASPDARAADLVRRMTLEEKVSQMMDQAPAIARLGVPKYGWWSEALHGVARAGHATVFPQAIGVAATWDTGLMHAIGGVIGVEGRAKYNDAVRAGNGTDRYYGVNFWSPNINIFRDPRWGRGQETYGEDPFLTGSMAEAFVRGVQGNDPAHPLAIATTKHFAVHSGPEPLRHGFNVDVSPHDFEDTYLPAFRMGIVQAKAQSLMCAYNAVDGAPACESDLLLGKTLRGDWKFKGFVVSDCDAVDDMVTGHKSEPDAAHASAAAVKAGTDLDCGRTYEGLTSAVRQGLLPEADLDRALVRLFSARMRLGLFDPGQGRYGRIGMDEVHSPAHAALALQAAEESIVLLKNSAGLLPLKGAPRIAVVGPNAELLQALEGNYNGVAVDPVYPLRGMREQFGAARIAYAPGAPLTSGMRMPVPSNVLRTPDGRPGLKAEYWDNTGFRGAPKVVGTDALINFDWAHVQPRPGVGQAYSVRWTGEIVPPAPGDYVFGFRFGRKKTSAAHAETMRLWIDDKLVFADDDPDKTITQHFDDARPHAVRIEYVRSGTEPNVAFQWIAPEQPLIDQAVAAARDSDVVVAFVGLSPDLEGEEMKVDFPGFHGGDRTDIALPAAQRKMLQALKATGKSLVVVSLTGSAIGDPWLLENADAVLQAWYPGEAGGRAIARTLAGLNNPSGRLPVTFYRDTAELPPFEDYSMKGRTYRYFGGPVLYPFGHGLSYTQFDYAGLKLSRPTLRAGQPLTLSVTIRNAGRRAGDEVAQLYVQGPPSPTAARHALAGFQRVHLAPGQAKRVTFTLDPRQLSQVDEKGGRAVNPGAYRVFVGGGQPGDGAGASAVLHVTGRAALPR